MEFCVEIGSFFSLLVSLTEDFVVAMGIFEFEFALKCFGKNNFYVYFVMFCKAVLDFLTEDYFLLN